MHTATALVERLSQTYKDLLLANLQNGLSFERNVCRASWVMRFTTHATEKRTPIKMHYGRILCTVENPTYKYIETKPSLLAISAKVFRKI